MVKIVMFNPEKEPKIKSNKEREREIASNFDTDTKENQDEVDPDKEATLISLRNEIEEKYGKKEQSTSLKSETITSPEILNLEKELVSKLTENLDKYKEKIYSPDLSSKDLVPFRQEVVKMIARGMYESIPQDFLDQPVMQNIFKESQKIIYALDVITEKEEVESLLSKNKEPEYKVSISTGGFARREIKDFSISKDTRILFIGGGSMPISAISYAEAGANVTVVDYDNVAIEKAKKVINELKLGERFSFINANGKDVSSSGYDLIALANMVDDKAGVINGVLETMDDDTKIFCRSTEKLGQLLYKPLKEIPTGLKLFKKISDEEIHITSLLMKKEVAENEKEGGRKYKRKRSKEDIKWVSSIAP